MNQQCPEEYMLYYSKADAHTAWSVNVCWPHYNKLDPLVISKDAVFFLKDKGNGLIL